LATRSQAMTLAAMSLIFRKSSKEARPSGSSVFFSAFFSCFFSFFSSF